MKFLLKEDFTPGHVNTFYYWLAPCLAMIPAITTLAVVPFGSTLFGVPMVIADINVGVLFVFAIASLGVYGIVIAGWSSNSKYPFLGGVRSTSQMISYELSLGLAVIPVFLLVGQLRLTEVVRYQIEHGWMIAPFVGDWTNLQKWLLAIPMMISFVVFTIAIFAETNRLPFDLARSRNGTGRRLSHRIRLDEVRPLFPRRIRRDDHRLRHHRDAFPGRLAFPRHPGRLPRMGSGGLVNIFVFFSKVAALALRVYLGALDASAFSLRSIDAAGLGLLFRDRARKHFPRRHHSRLFPHPNLPLPPPLPLPLLSMPFHHEKLIVYQRSLEFAGLVANP